MLIRGGGATAGKLRKGTSGRLLKFWSDTGLPLNHILDYGINTLAAPYAMLTPNELRTGINADLVLLLGTTMMSLARIGMSGLRPRMIAVMSTWISFLCPPCSSRKMTALPGAASGVLFSAIEIA